MIIESKRPDAMYSFSQGNQLAVAVRLAESTRTLKMEHRKVNAETETLCRAL